MFLGIVSSVHIGTAPSAGRTGKWSRDCSGWDVIVLGKPFLPSCKVWDVWFQSPCLYTESLRTGPIPDTDVHHKIQESYGTRRYPRQDTNTFLTVIFDMGIGNGVGIIEFHMCRGGDRYKQFPVCLRIIIPDNQPISEVTGIFWWTVEDCILQGGGGCMPGYLRQHL